MIELSSYGCKFTCSDGTWAVSGTVARVTRDAPASDPTPEPHTWSHEDILIAKPRKPTPLPPGVSAHTLAIHFERGYKEQVGTGGVRASPVSEPCTTSSHCTGPYAVVRYTYT